MKRLFEGICIALILMISQSCDYMESVFFTNRTQDTILIGSSRYNNIDSTEMFLSSAPMDTLTSDSDTITSARVYSHNWIIPNGDSLIFYCLETKINGSDKLSIGRHNLIAPDSISWYSELNCPLFYDNQDKAGYFFVITLETARNHTWNEICRDTLYDAIIITQDMLKQGRYFDYWGNDSLSVRQDNSDRRLSGATFKKK